MSQEVAVRDLTEEALVAAAKAGLETDISQIRIPFVKIGQSLTKEVKARDAEEGDWINGLTGEVYGRSVHLVIVDAFKGRFWKDKKTNDTYTTGKGEAVIPEHWPHPESGKFFADAEDAEEQYRAAVRANEKDWGSGPGISTTYNFVGLLLVEGEDGETELQEFPVRISLMRSSAKAGRNLETMLHLNRAPWDQVYELETRDATSSRGEPYMNVTVKQLRKTTPEERQVAVGVAQLVHTSDAVAYDGEVEEDAPKAPPKSKGGISDTI